MALPDFFRQGQGTAVIWGEDGAMGGDGAVTNTLSLDALASTKGRMGDVVDLGALWDQLYSVVLVLETGTAPSAGTTAQLWLACSVDGANFSGGITGSDAAYKDGEESEWSKQLGVPARVLVATNDANVAQRTTPGLWRPSARHVAPVVLNGLGQALRDLATPADNLSRVVLTPVHQSIEDTIA